MYPAESSVSYRLRWSLSVFLRRVTEQRNLDHATAAKKYLYVNSPDALLGYSFW